MSSTRRARGILDLLAVRPDGLSTPQIAELLGEFARHRRQRALTLCGTELRDLERKGRVQRAGRVPGGWQRGPAVIWAPASPEIVLAERARSAAEELIRVGYEALGSRLLKALGNPPPAPPR
jgi:hypothetical protein